MGSIRVRPVLPTSWPGSADCLGLSTFATELKCRVGFSSSQLEMKVQWRVPRRFTLAHRSRPARFLLAVRQARWEQLPCRTLELPCKPTTSYWEALTQGFTGVPRP